jgi:isocitrate dehydrogenase
VTVESGRMTRDLSILIGPDRPWMTRLAFLAKPDDNLKIAIK